MEWRFLSFMRKNLPLLSPGLLFIISYVFVISIGTILLKMPWATTVDDILWEDALFTATSAMCVTGLVVVDTGTFFSIYGQLVILGLIQIGGLGIMTFAALVFLSTGARISIRQHAFIRETYAPEHVKDIKHLVKFIFFFTIITEVIGAFLLSASWQASFSFGENVYYSFFHSISAFCNAGFSLFPDSFMQFYNHIALNLTVTSLIILGGLGFPVIQEIRSAIKSGMRNRFSLHTKLVLTVSLILIILGAVFFWAIEHDSYMAGMAIRDQFLVSYFQSVTARTAGFNTVDFNLLSNATLMFFIILMFIGGSPGSCAGGIKTTSIAALFVVMWNRLNGRETYNIAKATLPRETVSRAITIFIVSITFIIVIVSLLLITQLGDISHPQSRGMFLEYLFETVSAFGTVGLSMGPTAKMDAAGKISIIAAMFVGRVGILSLVYLMTQRRSAARYRFAEENILIG